MKAFRDSGISEQALLQYSAGAITDTNDAKYYTYNNLIKLPDMEVKNIQRSNLRNTSNKDLLAMAKLNALQSGAIDVPNTNNFIVKNGSSNIYINRKGLLHTKSGVLSNSRKTAIANVGELLKNAVKINETIRDGKTSSVYFGEYYQNGDSYIVRFIVDEGMLSGVSSKLYALSNKKSSMRTGIYPSTASASIEKITDLLGKVNGISEYKNDLPLDVYNQMNPSQQRGKSNLNNLQYSIGISSQDAKGRTLSKQQQEYFKNSKARDENGNLKVYYHGTSRADRIGTVFDPERATSGPMAYFTDNEQIAGNYARDKRDTSIAYDERYDSYYTQFRINHNGEDISVTDYWKTLPLSKRREIIEKAKHITMDDDWDNVVYDENVDTGLGNMDQYLLREHNGNAIEALVDSLLVDGNIYGEEQKFLDVLKLVGINDAQYLDPNYRDEKVYETYLNITNPLYTSELDMKF